MSEWEFKPARDMNVPFGKRIRSMDREPSIFSSAARLSWWGGFKLYMKICHRFRVEGQGHLPKNPPFVMVANHSSHLDVAALMLSLPIKHREVTFPLAAADHFFKDAPLAAFISFAVNGLPVSRNGDGKGREMLAGLRQRLLEDSCNLILFPEGTRSRTGEMSTFRSGIGTLVAGTSLPVLPCYIDGAFRAWPPSSKTPRPAKVTVKIGSPMEFSSFGSDKESSEAIALSLEEKVKALSEE